MRVKFAVLFMIAALFVEPQRPRDIGRRKRAE